MVLKAKSLVFVIFVFVTLDFGGDSILRSFPVDGFFWGGVGKVLISSMILILCLSFGLKLPAEQKLVTPFFLIISVILFGLFNGLVSNSYGHAISESIPFFFFLSFLSFASLKEPISILEVEKFLRIFSYIIFLKIIVYSVSSYALFGAVSWKILLKQSPLMLLPLSFYLSKIKLNSMTVVDYMPLFLLSIAVVFAMSRMLILATMFLMLVTFFNKHFYRNIPVVILFLGSLALYQIIIGSSGSSIAGFFYGGEVYEDGLDYRLVQLGIISDRFASSLFMGVGFGYFTEGYLDYYLLAKPYLLELDLLNFFSKVGLIGTLIYALAYFKIYQLIKSINDYNVQKVALALFWGLIGVLVYSLGQTAHQSYIFWFLLAFVYGFVVSHLRAQASSS